MAYANHTLATGGFANRITAAFHDIAERFERNRMFRRTYAELNALSARELDDLGISRSEIGHIAWESAYGK